MTDIVQITVDGRPLDVPAGRTIAAALMLEQQRMAWRTSRVTGRPRGVFCGIGVCFDCTAVIDGAHGLRTCLVEAADGMVVETSVQPPSIPDPSEPAQEAADDT